MPKLKTNRQAKKKFRERGNGSVKRAQAFTSHNTAKKSPKRIRNLRKSVTVDDANMNSVKGLLPYLSN